ncbi:hypothetical protein [Streptomyces californicus]|uniref:hypothetical protein n=1 Tax=Streptomyces californicus TaxID=67351 RepID=UPI0033F3DEBF
MDASGYAAWVAAVTSAATLVVTTVVSGRRERLQWARAALTDAFVAFLAASWQHSDLARKSPMPPDTASVEAMRDQYAEMRNQLTRLRLLSPPPVVHVGQALLRLQRAVQEAPSAPERATALAATSAARHDMVAAAQKAMGLRHPWTTGPSSPIPLPPRQPADPERARPGR